jgi:plasmid maintenance system killer protein
MDLTYYANLAEILGTAAIVVSLIYVAVQIRQNTRATKLTTAQNVSHDLRESIALIASSTEMAGIHIRGMQDIESLTPAEKHRFYIWLNHNFRMYEHAYYQNQEGALDAYIWEGVVANLTLAKGTSGYDTFWRDRSKIFSQEFRDFYESDVVEPIVKAHEPYQED